MATHKANEHSSIRTGTIDKNRSLRLSMRPLDATPHKILQILYGFTYNNSLEEQLMLFDAHVVEPCVSDTTCYMAQTDPVAGKRNSA